AAYCELMTVSAFSKSLTKAAFCATMRRSLLHCGGAMPFVSKQSSAFGRKLRGGGGIEYGLMIGLIGVVAISAIGLMGKSVTGLFDQAGGHLADSAAGVNHGGTGGEGEPAPPAPPADLVGGADAYSGALVGQMFPIAVA